MSDNTTNSFKIRLDDGAADHEEAPSKPAFGNTETEAHHHRVKPARNTPGWVSYLLIFLVLSVMIAGYFDIRNRLLSVHSSGSMETQHLSEDLQSKFSKLSIKFSALEESVAALLEGQTGLAGSLSTVTDDLSKASKTISKLNSSKADKKSLDTAVDKLEKEVSTLSDSVKKNMADTAVMSAKIQATTNTISTVSAKVSEELTALKAILDALQADKASKKDLLTEIDHLENVLKANQAQTDSRLSVSLQSLQRLESRVKALETKVGVSGQSDVTTAPGSRVSETPSPSLPKPGELIERDIGQ